MSERLLTIDVEAALKKVSIGRLRNRDQVPLALARCLAGQAPGAVRIWLGRSRVRLEADGRPFQAGAFELIHTLLDRGQDELVRHAALERLEAAGLLDLLVAFTAGAKTVIVESGPPTGLRLFGRAGRIALDRAPSGPGHNALVLGGLEGDPALQTRELEEHLRFAPFRVELNRARLDRGLELDGVVLLRRFEAGSMEGVVGLPAEGLAARTRLVVDGVVARQIWDSPPSGAVWDAVVRCPAGFEQRALAEVSRRVARLYRDVAAHYEDLPPEARDRLRQLVYRLGDHGAGGSAVAGIPIFRRVGGQAVEAAKLEAAASGRVVRAIGPGARAGRYELSGPVFVLDDRDRAFIERHLGLLVREPARRPSQTSRLFGWTDRLRERLRGLGRGWLRRLALGRPIPASELEEAERGFATALQAALDAGLVAGQSATRVTFCRGGLAGWRWFSDADGTAWLQLGRANPAVRAMVRAHAADPRRLFAALILLGDGRDGLFSERRAAEDLAGLTR